MMIFPPNNLPTASRSWARDVEKYISNLDSSFRSAEINNVSRDSQLIVTATSALTAATQAQEAVATAVAAQADADAAQTAAISANSTAISANSTAIEALQLAQSQQGEIDQAQNDALAALGQSDDAIAEAAAAAAAAAIAAQAASDANAEAIKALQGLANLDETTSTYKINAANVTVGNFNASLITTGVLNADLITTGSLSANRISGGNISGVGIYTSNGAGLTADLVAGSVNLAAPGTSGSLAASSSFGMVLNSSNIVRVSAPNGIEGASASFGNLTGGAIVNNSTYTGNGFPTIAANTVTGTTTFAPNVFINASGNMARNTTMSERRAKENIEEFEFDAEAFISINPVTFNYKREAVSDNEQAQAVNLGFILDDFEDAGLDQFLVAQPFEGDEYKQLRYNLLYMYLHKVVQEQHNTIKDLTARIEALESR